MPACTVQFAVEADKADSEDGRQRPAANDRCGFHPLRAQQNTGRQIAEEENAHAHGDNQHGQHALSGCKQLHHLFFVLLQFGKRYKQNGGNRCADQGKNSIDGVQRSFVQAEVMVGQIGADHKGVRPGGEPDGACGCWSVGTGLWV